MPARLLAYGGTSFSERRRIGHWPPVPEPTLRDSYGVQSSAWCYGMGVLDQQPFLIFRQRQNIENRGGYPFSLLLDPGTEVWERFAWNAAALVTVILETNPSLLFQTPEACSTEALDQLVGSFIAGNPAHASRPEFAALIAASLLGSETVVASPATAGFPARPDSGVVAEALAALPICFRASGGWLVGGGSAHGRALGARLVLDDQSPNDSGSSLDAGGKLIEAWQSVQRLGLVQLLDTKPMWTWDQNPAEILDAAMVVRDLEAAGSASDELLARALGVHAFEEPIEQLATDLLLRGDAPLGPQASALLIGRALNGKPKLNLPDATAARLDAGTVLTELRRFNSPPKRIPRTLPISRDLRVGLWIDYLERLRSDVRKSLTDALAQLGPGLDREELQALVKAAASALPASPERLLDWKAFQEDQEVWPLLRSSLREEARRRLRLNPKSGVAAYLLLGDDPGGTQAKFLLQDDGDFRNLAASVRALKDEYPEEASNWLEALPQAPKAAVPEPRVIDTPRSGADPNAAIREELEQVLFHTDGKQVERRASELQLQYPKLSAGTKASLDAMIEDGCSNSSEQFARAFSGKYLALGDLMSLVSEKAQKRLLQCLQEFQGAKFEEQASIDMRYALNNRSSQNAYIAALGRYLLDQPGRYKKVAAWMTEEPADLKKKLESMVKRKDGRG